MLEVERNGGVAIWTIDNPATKNALDRRTMDHLLVEVTTAAQDESLRAIVLTGRGDAFVSGGDLNELKEATTEQHAEQFVDQGAEICAALGNLRVPVIAALPGVAFGGGAELAIACDLRVAADRARISFKQVRMGVTTAWGTAPRLLSIVGASTAARLLFTAHEISARDALAMRLVDAVTPDGQSLQLALAWAKDVEKGSPRAIAQMKALLRDAREPGPDMLALERERFIATWTGDDHVEAMNAYFARRPPVWK